MICDESLDGFHTEMSFLCCTGHVLGSSGLPELLGLIYAPNAVVHILNGKAIARVVRAHFSVDAALNALILTAVLNAPLSIQPDESNSNNNAEVATVPPDDLSDEAIDTPDLDETRVVNEKLVDGTLSVEYMCRSDVLNRTKVRLHKDAESTNMSFRTASL